MSATKMTASEARVVKDAIAAIEVLARMVEELVYDGTCLGLDLKYVPPIQDMLSDLTFELEEIVYPPRASDPTWSDEQHDEADDERRAPINRREEQFKAKLRRELAIEDASSVAVAS